MGKKKLMSHNKIDLKQSIQWRDKMPGRGAILRERTLKENTKQNNNSNNNNNNNKGKEIKRKKTLILDDGCLKKLHG